ncbi:hypothetical protein TYRP_001729 [Tyrophagus putrescentiae]|nr:hypothetical protein TYRP_001729 [Tyrophagus putrescentiae]
MTEQVARKSSRGITGEHHQRKAPLMMMDPGLGCETLVTENAEAQDMRAEHKSSGGELMGEAKQV